MRIHIKKDIQQYVRKCYVFSVKPVQNSKAYKKVSPTFSGYILAHSDSSEVLELENAKKNIRCQGYPQIW